MGPVPRDGGVGRMGLTRIFFLVVALEPRGLCTKSGQSAADVLSSAKRVDGNSFFIFFPRKESGGRDRKRTGGGCVIKPPTEFQGGGVVDPG